MYETDSPPKRQAKSRTYGQLTGLGTINPENRIAPPLRETKRLEVSVTQDTSKSAVSVALLIPTKRSPRGSRRVTALTLNGSQARELYETLNQFFQNDSNL